jgi:DegT/DnrJ/EryC1/StrS aminotransferase family
VNRPFPAPRADAAQGADAPHDAAQRPDAAPCADELQRPDGPQRADSRAVDGALAIDGGAAVRCRPPPSWPVFAADEIAAVVATLQSGKVNQWTGAQVLAFERAFAAMLGRPYAVAVANGTVALEIILKAYGIGPGDEVIVTPRSFIASAACVNLVGATPVFADVDLDTEMITPQTVRPMIGPRTRAINVVHLHGRPADMPGFTHLARRHGLLGSRTAPRRKARASTAGRSVRSAMRAPSRSARTRS